MTILDVGSGKYPKLNSDYSEIQITFCDITPSEDVEFQDMEKLTYEDNSFDVVTCINALDHTEDALGAVKELIRVSRGIVYINCALDQMTRHRKKHYWDAKADGTLVNREGAVVNLPAFGFNIDFDDGRVIARKYA